MFAEQKRIFSMIPGLENAKFARYGVMHRNTYLCSPRILNETLQCKQYPNLFMAGQMVGVEGYVESAATGILAAINAIHQYRKQSLILLPKNTMLGSLCYYISHAAVTKFQPMNANYGILATHRDKIKIAKESIEALTQWKTQNKV